jgi:hypothetical protein
MTSLWKRTLSTSAAILLALSSAGVAFGQERDEYGDIIQTDIEQTVARVSHLQGSASYSRGDDPDNWQPADVNIPMTLGDRIYTGPRSRLELQVHGGDIVRLGSRTDLAALNLTDDTKQFAIKAGIASFRVRRLDENDLWEVDTPNAAVTFEQPGNYRIDVDQDGYTRVSVLSGAASVAAGGGQVALHTGDAMSIDGIESPRYSVFGLSSPDRWDRWVNVREGSMSRARSYQYVSAGVVGAEDLDEYGRWEEIPEYGHVWTPLTVEVGWAPYRVGHWVWQDPWGWTWISTEPWGWAPYHYGRWVTYSSRWYWVPVAPTVRTVAYAPALVAFVGGGPGFSASVTIGGGGVVGWFPLAPRDPLIPWWRREAVNVNVTNVTYVNRTYVTVVNQNTFVSGGLVTRNIVTDRTVVQQVAAAPVVRGAVPIVPTMASTRVSVRTQAAAPRPPAAVTSRAVVARVAPPPAPPRFEQKLAVIKQNGGAPVTQAAATRLTAAEQRQPRTITSVRPVAAESGRVTLAPASKPSAKPANVQPVAPAPVRGRPMATAQQPVASGPVTGRGRSVPPVGAEPRVAPQQPTAPEARPGREIAPERERVATPPISRVQPTPREERPGREVAPERERVATPPSWRERSRPTPGEERPGREVAPERGRVPTPPYMRERRQPTPREERPGREVAPERGRAVTPPAGRERVEPTPSEDRRGREVAPERERVQRPPAPGERSQPEVTPERSRSEGGSAQRGRPQPRPKPTKTPQKPES